MNKMTNELACMLNCTVSFGKNKNARQINYEVICRISMCVCAHLFVCLFVAFVLGAIHSTRHTYKVIN